MEVLKTLKELKIIHKQISTPFLKHLFKDFDPDTSEKYQYVTINIHLKDADSSDYRSAHRQLCDWLYGWKVTDVDMRRRSSVKKNSISKSDRGFSISKYCRDIDFENEVEKSECERLVNIFDALFNVTQRNMAKKYLELEAMVPRIGQGLKTMANDHTQLNDAKDLGTSNGAPGLPPLFPTNSSLSNLSTSEEELGKQASGSQTNLNSRPTIENNNNQEGVEENMVNVISTETNDNLTSTSKWIQADIDDLIVELCKALDFHLLCVAICDIILAFSEIIGQADTFQNYNSIAHELATELVSNTLAILWEVFKKDQNGSSITLIEFRNLQSLEAKIASSFTDTTVRSLLDTIASKLWVIDLLLSVADVFIFPEHIFAHQNGTRALHGSLLDESLWLSSGCDKVVRIHELKSPYTCYAQYVGHVSIVTDIKFIRDDMYFVSASFDRTIKIWNATTAVCEKTLTGHEDAVTCLDVTTDSRYIVSGSLDCTVKLWDINSTSLVISVKKHTKWVKVVRFSHDGRYLGSGGLDSKVYIWETKSLASGKITEPMRVIDHHLDIVLDIAFQKPSWILTCSRDKTVRMMDFMNGKELHQHNLGNNRWACSLAFSKDGKVYAVATFDHNIFIYSTEKGELLRSIRVFSMGIICIKFPHKEKPDYLAVGTAEGFIQKIPL